MTAVARVGGGGRGKADVPWGLAGAATHGRSLHCSALSRGVSYADSKTCWGVRVMREKVEDDRCCCWRILESWADRPPVQQMPLKASRAPGRITELNRDGARCSGRFRSRYSALT